MGEKVKMGGERGAKEARANDGGSEARRKRGESEGESEAAAAKARRHA